MLDDPKKIKCCSGTPGPLMMKVSGLQLQTGPKFPPLWVLSPSRRKGAPNTESQGPLLVYRQMGRKGG